MELISSVKNQKIVESVKLQNIKERKKQGLFTVDGLKLINEAIKSGYELESCYVTDGADVSLLNTDINIYFVTDNVMQKLSTLSTPQSFFGVFRSKTSGNLVFDTTVLALETIQDPQNVGAIIRSAEAFGVHTVLLGNGCCDLFSPKALRAAMGSAFRVNAVLCDLNEALPKYSQNGYTVIGAGLNKNYTTTEVLKSYEKKVIVIGNEGNGISKEVQALCSLGMYIPMSGQNESLNAAVAASILLWENQRQSNE